MLKVALISIGHCPSLALRNIRAYCLTHKDIASTASFRVFDYPIDEFRSARNQSALQWSFTTKFDEAVVELRRWNPDIVAFSCYLWNTDLSLHLAQLLKQVSPTAHVVIGGPDAGPRAAELLATHPCCDAVIEGDGEVPFLAMMRGALASGALDFTSIPSAHYRANGTVVSNPASSDLPDLSRLKGVCQDLPRAMQTANWNWNYVPYETLRGCPYSCSYCMYGKTKMNEKSTAMAVSELLALMRKGLTVNILDPTFTTYQDRAKRILRELSRHSYSGGLYFEAYPDSIDEEMADLMASARVAIVGLGFQTISSEGLKAVKRPKNLARFERAVRLLTDHGITYYADIIYGLPGTTVDDFLATTDYLFDLGVPTVIMYRLLGLPGSPMMDDAEKYGMRFSRVPPYELLASDSYSLDDVRFCERYQQAYQELPRVAGADNLRRHAARAGGISNLVKRYLDEKSGDPGGFLQQLRAEADEHLDVPDTLRWPETTTTERAGAAARN